MQTPTRSLVGFQCRAHPARFRLDRLVGWLILAGLFATLASAQPAPAGTIAGRVFNAATKEYVRNAEVRVEGTNLVAYSEDAGYYRIAGAPAGNVTLTVTYTGSQPETAVVSVGAGQTATRDFELRPAGAAPGGQAIVQLGEFTVSAEREGQAKAIMDRRAALNAKEIVASDNFGDLTMGDVGEFLKYMPGMTLDFLEVDTSAVRIGGLDPTYSAFTQDGIRMAASDPGFGDASRRNTFEQMSITGTDVVELNNTLTASMDADSPAGTINLRSKNAFDRKERRIAFQSYLAGSTDAMTLRREYLPDDEKHHKVFPAGQFSYADSFLNHRLGIEFNTSYNASFVQQDRNQVQYDYTNPAQPIITGIMWRPGPKVTSRFAGNLSADLKINPELVFSWRSTFSIYDVEFFNQYTWLRASRAQITPDSTFTKVTALATNNANTRLGTEYSHRYNYQPNFVLAPKLEWKHDTLTLTARGGYSKSRTSNQDRTRGFFRNTNNRITRTGWIAERSSADSPEWFVTQVKTPGGPDWSNPADWGTRDTHNNNIVSNADETRAQVFTGYLDAKKSLSLLELPVELKAGFGSRLNTYMFRGGNQQWTYLGPSGVQTQTGVVPWTENYHFDFDLGGKAGNINSLGWRADDTYEMYRVFQEHPEWFRPDTLGNFSRWLIGPRSIKEEIDSAYVEGSTRWRKLHLDGGLRWERTRTKAFVWDPRPKAEIIAAGYPVSATGAPTTAEGVLYQYHNGERSTRYGDYDHTFLSGGAKYFFTRNLLAQLSASEAVRRPSYNNLAGVTTINETAATVTVPNPELQPETSTKYFASLQYYFEPAGTLTLSAYRLNVKNQLTARSQVAAEQVGLTEEDYPGYLFFGYLNGNGTRRTDGVTLQYDQKLNFLPGALRGLSVFGSVTRAASDREQIGVVPKSANGGIRYRYGPLSAQVRSTWQSPRLLSISSPNNGHVRLAERTLIDVSGGYRLTKNFELMFSVRNVFNAPSRQYSNEPGRTQLYDVYGSLWNFGIKGTF